mmetsp:Transcript_3680/g.8276  ORF Transcript_3680/g.8276 Transcript_3680/m.8276 type:complete len:230 (+) Transcript_3680:38-727(+)
MLLYLYVEKCLRLFLLHLLLDPVHSLEQVAGVSHVGDAEKWAVFILVHSHNHLAVLHAGDVLNRARYAERDVHLGCHHLTRLSNLHVICAHARIHRRTTRADGGIWPESIREAVQLVKVISNATSSTDDDTRGAEVRSLARVLVLRAHKFSERRGTCCGSECVVTDLDDGRGVGIVRLCGVEGGWSERDDGWSVARALDRLHGVSRIARSRECLCVDSVDDVRDERAIE